MPLYLMSNDYRIDVADSDLVEGGSETVSYVVKPVTREDFRRITAAHTKRRVNPDTRQMVEVTDAVKASEDLLDAALVGWSGVLDPETNAPVPCERVYKLMLDPERGSKLISLATKSQVVDDQEGRVKSFRRSP